tara:strand:- start:2198 stop:3373 length:1176 start_codon:yes stop_codon:yes gene_type:complete
MSKTICILPWIHMYVNADGNVLPCCIGDYKQPLGNTHNRSIEDIWNSHEYKTLRKQLMNGEKPSICHQCWKHEEAGNNSSRISNNKRFKEDLHIIDKTNADGSLDSMDLRYFDVRWSNICNFKCRTCSATYSSNWAVEDNQQGDNKPVYIFAGGDSNDSLYNQFKPHFKNIKVFYFAGGEPLMTDKHYEILEHLIETGNTKVTLEYNSNVSRLKYKNKSIIDLWNKFENVTVSASLDSWGSRAEYIREGTDWDKVESNLQTIKEKCPHVKISFNTVVSIFNLCTLTDFLKYITAKGFNTNNGSLYNIVDPNYYSVSAMPQQLKNTAKSKIEDYMNDNPGKFSHQLKGVLRYIDNSKFDESAYKLFKAKTFYYDKIRKRDFVETFPELVDVI